MTVILIEILIVVALLVANGVFAMCARDPVAQDRRIRTFILPGLRGQQGSHRRDRFREIHLRESRRRDSRARRGLDHPTCLRCAG